MFLKGISQFQFVEVVTVFFFFLVQILMLTTFLLTNKQQRCHWCPVQFVSPWKRMFSNFFPTYSHSRTGPKAGSTRICHFTISRMTNHVLFNDVSSSLVLSVQDHHWLQPYFRIVWPPLACTLILKEHLECVGGGAWRGGRPKKHYPCLGRKSKSKRKSLLFQIKNGMSSEVRNWRRCTQLTSALSELLALGLFTILVHPSLVSFFPNLWPNNNRSAPLVELLWTLQWHGQMGIKTLANVRCYLKWKLFQSRK